ncbi:hypothetical protein LHK94_20535 [Dickeya zeae]|uniref:hypothetical protein n=1 Tax=Dickeya zeae TaxID=204042 RepID=UPI001CFBB5DB|nr:hypothetical protein [Dickeya zeae]UCZ75343.1 hypothetical protein LHK94_20535 [Dickeya zeae]
MLNDSGNDVQQSIASLLINAFAREFWLNAQDELQTIYEAAQSVTVGDTLKLDQQEQVRFRAQARHYSLNSALRRAAAKSEVCCTTATTIPKGENYLIISSLGIKLSRLGINHDEKLMRGAKHRKLLAELNGEYEGYTPDMFSPLQQEPHRGGGSLGAFLININPPKHMSQESMLDLRVVVPFTNLKGYHFNWSVTDLLGVYNSANEQITPDLVIPVLKKQLKEQEGS